jgi:hypothetical protein
MVLYGFTLSLIIFACVNLIYYYCDIELEGVVWSRMMLTFIWNTFFSAITDGIGLWLTKVWMIPPPLLPPLICSYSFFTHSCNGRLW